MTAPRGRLGYDRLTVELNDRTLANNLADLRHQLLNHVRAGARTIVVDLANVDRLPSGVVAVLLNTHRICRGRGGGIVLRRPSRRTLDQLHRTGLRHVMSVDSAPSR